MKSNVQVRDNYIATKLIPPRWDERGVPRKLVLEQLKDPDHRLSVISIVAAAGSGKSTLMAELHSVLSQRDAATCWISIDADDNNPATFAAYFIAALNEIEPLGEGQDFAIQKDFPIRAFDELFEELVVYVSNIKHHAAIFIDDFQHITDPQVVAFVERLIAHLPVRVKVIIASRTRLPMELGRARVSGIVAEIEQDDLNFNALEARDFLRQSHNLELSTEDVESLWSTTEGWAAGMQLAALALRRNQGGASELVQQFSGRDKDLMTYLAQSVLNSQPESVRLFLLRTAPLRRMCADLCAVTSGHPNPNEMLVHLERCKLFIIPLDRTGQWYRYHHLFGDFLKNQLRQADPKLFESICERAGAWCEEQGQITEAIQYALDAHQFDKATDLIATRALNFSQQGEHYTVLDWMRRLPVEYHMRRPEIGLSHAWACAFSRDTPLSMELSNQVISRLRSKKRSSEWSLTEAERERLQFFAEAVQAVAKTGSDELNVGSAHAEQLRKHCPEEEPFVIASACNCISYNHLARRDFASATRVSADGYLYGQRAASTYAMVWADIIHGMADIELGKLKTAQEHAHRSKLTAGGTSTMKSCSGAMAALLHAEITTQRCDFQQTQRYMETGRSFAVIFGMVEILQLAYRNDARVCAWTSNLPQARLVLEQGRAMALKSNYPRLFLSLAIEEVALLIMAGQLDEATETANAFSLFEESDSIHNFDASNALKNQLKLLRARLVLLGGDAPQALRLLSQLQYTLGTDVDTNLHLTLRAAKAMALWQMDRHAESVRELDRAMASAASEGCAYPIVSCGRGLLPILKAIEEKRDAPIHRDGEAIARLGRLMVSVLSGKQSESIESAPAQEPAPVQNDALTMREIELLRLVESGLRNKKVADMLLISESTVKWHLHNINEKLGVANRTAAAAKAREMMLL
mgnify:FL=1|tara:strand:- start:14124 stop:16895 length:2772 start_codon:yes stop_codon:yes gene_type:complete